MEEPWHYLIDQFVSSTVNNLKKALKLTNYHDAYLNKMQIEEPLDPDWATLYNRYHPFHLAYVNAYSNWKIAGNTQKGQTLNVDQLLALLVTRVGTWDMQIQLVPGYEKGTSGYIALFPLGRRPFNTGAKATRMDAVKNLGEQLAAIPALAAIGGTVTTFYNLLDAASDTQESAKGGTKAKSTGVDLHRVETMTEQYRNLGFLINKSAELPQHIAPFFELNVLRESNQVIFTGTLDPSETEAVLIHTFVEDDELELKVTGDPATPAGTMVQFYLSNVNGGTNSTAVNVEVNAAPLKITAAAFGISNYGTYRYFTAVNTNGVELHYVVELL